MIHPLPGELISAPRMTRATLSPGSGWPHRPGQPFWKSSPLPTLQAGHPPAATAPRPSSMPPSVSPGDPNLPPPGPCTLASVMERARALELASAGFDSCLVSLWPLASGKSPALQGHRGCGQTLPAPPAGYRTGPGTLRLGPNVQTCTPGPLWPGSWQPEVWGERKGSGANAPVPRSLVVNSKAELPTSKSPQQDLAPAARGR